MEDEKLISRGDRVEWSYMHQCGGSRWRKYKWGTVLKLGTKKKSEQLLIKLDGNDFPGWKHIGSVRKIEK